MCSHTAAQVCSSPLLSLCAPAQELDLLEWVQAADHADDSTQPLPHNAPLQEQLIQHTPLSLSANTNFSLTMENITLKNYSTQKLTPNHKNK